MRSLNSARRASDAREKNAPHKAEPRVPPAQTKDEFLTFLLSLRDQVYDETFAQSDLVKPGLLNVVSGLDTLADAIRTEAGKRPAGDE